MNTWWRCPHRRPAAPARIVCLPHAGGAASFFARWATAVGDEIEVVVAQYPGREDRLAEPMVDRMEELVSVLLEHLQPFLDRRVLLLGHSMGALVAHELACRIDPSEQDLVALFVSGMGAPGFRRPLDLGSGDDEAILAAIDGLGGSTRALRESAELRRCLMPAIRTDLALVEDHLHAVGPLLTSPITAVVGNRDPRVHPSEAEAWARHTTGEFRLETLHGGHFAIGETTGRDHVAALVRDVLVVRD